MTIIDAHPAIVDPEKLAITAAAAAINDRSDTVAPAMNMKRSGRAENEVIPSHANESILRRGYFDSPATR